MCDGEVYEGGGLFGSKYEPPPCDTGALASSETADTAVAWGGGGGFGDKSGGCSTAPSISGWWLAFVLIWGLWSTAFAQDLQTVQPLDGDMVAVRSATHAPRWAPWAVLTHQTGFMPVTAVSETGKRTVVDQLSSTVLSAGWSFGLVQFGATLPYHSVRWTPPVEGDPARVDRGFGDLLFLLSVSSQTRWGRLALRSTYERPVSKQAVSSQSGFTTTLALAGKGAIRPAGHVGVRVQSKVEVPGQLVGNRLEAGLGVHWRIKPWATAMLESIASFPIAGGFLWRAAPIEALGAIEVQPTPGFAVRPFVGMGITSGLGAARVRLGLSVRAQGHAPRDTDGDGYHDLRDLCVKQPEDRDGYQDWDGCPDPDNDRDGIPDVDDACPLEPEQVNGLLDVDGCPDAWPRLSIEVASPEVVRVTVGNEVRELLAGERWEQDTRLAALRVMAEAPGHLARGWSVNPDPGEVFNLKIHLEPEVRSPLCLHVEDTAGLPLPVQVTGDLDVQFTGDHCESVRHGLLALSIRSGGYPTEAAEVQVSGPTEVHLVMVKPAVALQGRRITLNQDLGFALGDDSLAAIDGSVLDALAAWLRANPWILLVSVEGHADTIGGSAYNFGLSNRRASRVRQALIERGIEPERLTPRAWGESLSGNGPERTVGFTVLVVDESLEP